MRLYKNFAWFTLAFCVGVILWGAYVRATGSGAGCGSHWPLCNGAVVPRDPTIQTVIEYTHRLTSGLSLLFVIALYVWTRRLFPAGSFQRKAALLSLIAILIEALIGAMLVLLSLVEHDQSLDRAISIALHLVNTLFLLGALTVTALAADERAPRWRLPPGKARFWARGLLGGFVLLGALGALTALGDTLFPASSFREGLQADFDEKRHFLERIRLFHPVAALAWFGGLWSWAFTLSDRIPVLGARAKLLLAIVAANLGLGLANVLLLAPVPLQILHLLVADLLWILFVSLLFSAASRWQ